ncbi:MAG: DUF1648 domain-containing protein [Polyangia bacterium]|mgnify:CR=1 FL=1|jgi:uncharacterized membrane protein|nr:DUF1648 domain-containing protein [Polyangia bacterium]
MTGDGKDERLRLGRVWDLVAVNIVLVGASFALAAAWSAKLPARHPVHWNAAGQPDRWVAAGSCEWYVLPIVAAALAALLVALALLMPRIPLSMWNMPRKEQFMALPREAKESVATWLVRWLLDVSSMNTILMILIQFLMYRSIVGGRSVASWGLGLVGLLYAGWMVWGVVGFMRRVRSAEAEVARGNGGGSAG